MSILRFMGIIDLALVSLILFQTLFPEQWMATAGTYMIFKGGLFALFGDLISYFDIGIGVYLFLISWGLSSTILSVIAIFFLIQKGLVSLW